MNLVLSSKSDSSKCAFLGYFSFSQFLATCQKLAKTKIAQKNAYMQHSEVRAKVVQNNMNF